ncbi:presenilins-associated rhomboid-like protein, mitochondrial [Daktulosphaira vitifoliae]|uniref:presenilins-associated rhomboid-like protein, mitochondrial n=1 Tax=Daktulosphaira vitifoliae TaxID=58002 RepID=UPI0021A97CB9|nr:presenilins-associated rhomboid-like protein, mitochondrial [Daktulosphaira vitifoliae]
MWPNVKQICKLFEIQQTYQNSFNNKRNTKNQIDNRTNISNFCLFKIFIRIVLVSVVVLTIAAIIEYEQQPKLNKWKSITISLDFIKNIIQNLNNIVQFIRLPKNYNPRLIAFTIVTFSNIAIFFIDNIFEFKLGDSKSFTSLLMSSFCHENLWDLTFATYYLYQTLYGINSVNIWPFYITRFYIGIEEFFVLYLIASFMIAFTRYVFMQKLQLCHCKQGSLGAISAVLGCLTHIPSYKQIFFGLIYPDINSINSCEILSIFMAFSIIGLHLKQFKLDSLNIAIGYLFGRFWRVLGSVYIWGNRKFLIIGWIRLKKLF